MTVGPPGAGEEEIGLYMEGTRSLQIQRVGEE